MRSVADDQRVEQQADQARLRPEERVALALQLGLRDAKIHASAEKLPLAAAIAALRRERQTGRRSSGCAAP